MKVNLYNLGKTKWQWWFLVLPVSSKNNRRALLGISRDIELPVLGMHEESGKGATRLALFYFWIYRLEDGLYVG